MAEKKKELKKKADQAVGRALEKARAVKENKVF